MRYDFINLGKVIYIVTVQPLTVGLGVLPNKWMKELFLIPTVHDDYSF